MSDNVYIEIDSDVCIICLEKIDNVTECENVCIKCNVKSHKKCLRMWYRKKRKRVCPICLKTERYYFNSVLQSTSLYNNYSNNNIDNNQENTDNNQENIDNNQENIDNNQENIDNNQENIDNNQNNSSEYNLNDQINTNIVYEDYNEEDYIDEDYNSDIDNTDNRIILVNNRDNIDNINNGGLKYIYFALFLIILFIGFYVFSNYNIRLF